MVPLTKATLTVCDLDIEGSHIQDAASILTTLYPALIQFARHELHANGENPELAEDLVQGACLSWSELIGVESRAYAYMRKAVKNQVADLKRPRREAMTHRPLSIDAISEEG